MCRQVALLCAALLAGTLSGCQVGFFHARTTWNSDGSIDRDILQPKGRMADGVESGQGWTFTRTVNEPEADFRGDVLELPEDVDGGYFVGSVSAGDSAALPDHYHKTAKDDQYSSRLERRAERIDCGLVVEYVWEETLTEVVSLPDLRKAVNELTDIVADGVPAVLGDALEVECDTSRLKSWIDTDGRSLVLEFIDVLYEAGLRRKAEDPEMLVALNEILHRHGLNVELGEAWDDDDEAVLQEFCLELLCETVRKPDGSELDESSLEQFRHFITGADKAVHDAFEQRLQSAGEDYKRNWPGGVEAFDARMNLLGARILGVHGVIFGSPEKFRYRMTLPGEIVETNGRLLGSKSVEWQFDQGDVWPAGYVMRVRSLHDHSAMLADSLTANFEPSRDNLLQIAAAVGDDALLQETLRRCRKEQTERPLSELEDELPADSPTRERIYELRRLLSP